MAAMQAGTQNEMAGEQGLRPSENIKHFLLLGIHKDKGATVPGIVKKPKHFFALPIRGR
jgi:hypothetical protein